MVLNGQCADKTKRVCVRACVCVVDLPAGWVDDLCVCIIKNVIYDGPMDHHTQ